MKMHTTADTGEYFSACVSRAKRGGGGGGCKTQQKYKVE